MPYAFTLLEVLLASAILSLAVAALAQAIVSGQSHTYTSIERMRASALGQALMEEILTLPYHDVQGVVSLGPDAGMNRRDQFGRIDDFHGYEELPGSLKDLAGELYGQAYQTFTRRVAVEAVTQELAGFDDLPGLRVTVHVEGSRGQAWTLERFVPQPKIQGEETP